MRIEYTVRDIKPSDCPHMLELHLAAIMAISDSFYSLHLKRSWMVGLSPEGYGRSVDNGEVFDIAVDKRSGKPVAFCGCKGEEIYGLFVHPDAQGQGIGAELTRCGEARLQSWGVRRAQLEAALSAASFYAQNGWRLHGVGHRRTRGGVIMEIALMDKMLA